MRSAVGTSCGATSTPGSAPNAARPMSLVPSSTIACVTPLWPSTSRAKRDRPLGPMLSTSKRLPPMPALITDTSCAACGLSRSRVASMSG
ncbi:hypothetical protein FQZ97_816190 [compost metagenome]